MCARDGVAAPDGDVTVTENANASVVGSKAEDPIETLSTIAVRYRTSIDRIRDANNLWSSRMIRAGQKLRIPLTNASLSLALP